MAFIIKRVWYYQNIWVYRPLILVINDLLVSKQEKRNMQPALNSTLAVLPDSITSQNFMQLISQTRHWATAYFMSLERNKKLRLLGGCGIIGFLFRGGFMQTFLKQHIWINYKGGGEFGGSFERNSRFCHFHLAICHYEIPIAHFKHTIYPFGQKSHQTTPFTRSTGNVNKEVNYSKMIWDMSQFTKKAKIRSNA